MHVHTLKLVFSFCSPKIKFEKKRIMKREFAYLLFIERGVSAGLPFVVDVIII